MQNTTQHKMDRALASQRHFIASAVERIVDIKDVRAKLPPWRWFMHWLLGRQQHRLWREVARRAVVADAIVKTREHLAAKPAAMPCPRTPSNTCGVREYTIGSITVGDSGALLDAMTAKA